MARVLTCVALLLAAVVPSPSLAALSALQIVPEPVPAIAGSSTLSAPVLMTIAAAVAVTLMGLCVAVGRNGRRIQGMLHERGILLDAALNNVVQGVTMFDRAGRLVLHNERYLQMYGLSPDVVKPGCSIRDLVAHRMARGTFFSADPEHYIATIASDLAHRQSRQDILELQDGRVICVHSQPMAEGGWVITHEDITARHRAQKELENTRNFLHTVIENVPATIIVKDARDLRYVLINRAGEEIYGISRDNMIGKTAYDLFSKAHADFITKYDRQLVETCDRHFSDVHPIETPNHGARLVTSTRLPILGHDGTPQYVVTVLQDVTEHKRAEARIAHLAHHDALTDLPNRAAFNECLATTLERAAATGGSFAVLSIDLDRFKEINDVFGPSVGDALLRAITARLAAIAEGSFLARLGGDEFALIITEGPHPARAAQLADRVLAALSEDLMIEGHGVRMSLSIGIAIHPNDGADAATLLANAEAALYRAKANGCGSICFFEAEMDHRLREKRALVQDLRSAIARNELLVHYQPQARVDGVITGFEALVRWRHPTRGLISPGVFVPMAEESGLILAIGEWVLRQACREAASWPKPLNVAVNLSAVQFRHGDLPGLVHGVLLETGLSPHRLELEITESVLVDNFARAVSILRRLRALGVNIAMDDFGTGYSSLSNLQTFAFDKIKIDRSFISNLESNPQSATIVRAVIGLGRGLDLPVIAEGVETREQLEFLSAEACAEVQGYLVGKPMPIEAYAAAVGRGAAEGTPMVAA
jgi:diguanylate cyclase (GGDEF)-like protein/PAS domain S-box-containing protein